MKSLINCRALIRMAVIIVVMAFMASQMTDTYAGSRCKYGNHSFDNRGKCKKCKKIIKVIVNNNGNGNNGEVHKVEVTNWDVYPDVYPSGINIPKHFTVVLYSKGKKLWAH